MCDVIPKISLDLCTWIFLLYHFNPTFVRFSQQNYLVRAMIWLQISHALKPQGLSRDRLKKEKVFLTEMYQYIKLLLKKNPETVCRITLSLGEDRGVFLS